MYRPLSNRDKLVPNCHLDMRENFCCDAVLLKKSTRSATLTVFGFDFFRYASFTFFQLFKGTQFLLLKIFLCFT